MTSKYYSIQNRIKKAEELLESVKKDLSNVPRRSHEPWEISEDEVFIGRLGEFILKNALHFERTPVAIKCRILKLLPSLQVD